MGACTGISTREVERTREGREECVVWEKRRRRTGLCRYSEYYVGRPSSRATSTTVKETVFDANPDQIKVLCFHWSLPLAPCANS